MKKFTTMLAIAISITLLISCGNRTSSGRVLVDINGNKITEGDLDFLGEINPRIQAQISSPAGKKKILDNLVDQELLYQEAVKEGINRDPKVKAKVDLYRRVIIAQSLVENQIEKSAKKYYDEHPEDFNKIKLSQIMVKYASPEDIKAGNKSKNRKNDKQLRTEKDALEIITKIKEKLDKGEDFATLAREDSEDIATKSRGGDLGLISKDDKRLTNRGFGPLIDKAFTLKTGDVAGPIKTSKGYHLIKVTQGAQPETFDQAKQNIIFKVRGDAKNDLLAGLKKGATIVYPDKEDKKDVANKGNEKDKTKALELNKDDIMKKAKEVLKEKGETKEVAKGDKIKVEKKTKETR